MAEQYHFTGPFAEQTEASTLDTLLYNFEDAEPYPDSVVPNIPQDAKAQLGTIDKLAQVIIPKLVDRLNEANWKIKRLEYLIIKHNSAIEMMQRHMASVAPVKEKQKRTRKKKSDAETTIVDVSEIADYDPDTDTWGPITIDGKQITGALIDVVEHLSGAAGQMYSDELVQFIRNLEPQVKKAIAERFPN